MLFTTEPLRISTLDGRDTYYREDGFRARLDTESIQLTSLVPDTRQIDFHVLAGLLAGHHSRKSGKLVQFLFKQKKRVCLSLVRPSKVLVLELKKPYDRGVITTNKAVIRRALLHENIPELLEKKDLELTLMWKFAASHLGNNFKSQEVTTLMNNMLNEAAQDSLIASGVPFLGRISRSEIAICEGVSKVSAPINDATSLVNAIQLSQFLETGEAKLTTDDLKKLLVLA